MNNKKVYLTAAERNKAKERFGNYKCSIAKDNQGYYAYTHRARTKSYATLDKLPKSRVKFIESTC